MTDQEIYFLAKHLHQTKTASLLGNALTLVKKAPFLSHTLVGAGTGIVAGGIHGATSENSNVLQGALKGGLVGAGIGAGVGVLRNRTSTVDFLRNTVGQNLPHNVITHNKLTSDQIAAAGDTGVHSIFGMGPKAKLTAQEVSTPVNSAKDGWVKGMLGEAVHNTADFLEHPGNYLKKEWGHALTFKGKDSRIYQRSLPGKALNLLNTGPGIAALSTVPALMSSSDASTKTKQVGAGLATGAMWSVAPRLGMVGLTGQMAYGILKRPKKPQPATIQNDTQFIQ